MNIAFMSIALTLPQGGAGAGGYTILSKIGVENGSFVFSEDGSLLVHGSEDGLLSVYRASGQLIKRIEGRETPILSMTFVGGNRLLASAGPESIEYPNGRFPFTTPRALRNRQPGLSQEYQVVPWKDSLRNPDRGFRNSDAPMMLNKRDFPEIPRHGVVDVWDLESGKKIKFLGGFENPVDFVSCSGHDGPLIASDLGFHIKPLSLNGEIAPKESGQGGPVRFMTIPTIQTRFRL